MLDIIYTSRINSRKKQRVSFEMWTIRDLLIRQDNTHANLFRKFRFARLEEVLDVSKKYLRLKTIDEYG